MKYISLLLFLLSSNLLIAQDDSKIPAELTWGQTFKEKKRSQMLGIVGKTKDAYFTLNFNKGKYSLHKMDKNLSPIEKYPLGMEYEGKRLSFEGITQIKDQFFLLSSFSNQKLKKNFLFIQKISSANPLEISKLEKVAEISFSKRRFTGSFNYSVSSDSSKILVYYNQPYVKNGPEKFGFSVYDTDLNPVWNKDISTPFNEDLFSVMGYRVANNGDVYLSGKEYKNELKGKNRDNKPSYVYHILSYTDKGEHMKDYEIDLGDKFITDLQFALDDEKALRCGGFYSMNSSQGIKGTFYITIDLESKKTMTSNFKPFPEDFITQGWSQRAIKKAKKKEVKKGKAVEMYEYDLRDFILKDDGGIIMLAEQYYVHVVTTTTYDAQGRPTTRTTYHYYYNDIIAINIDANGNIEWQTKIDKYQHSTNDGGYFSSYTAAVVGDKIFMVYNEDARRYYTKEQLKSLSRKEKKAYFTLLVELNSDGEYKKTPLFNTKENQVATRPKASMQTGDRELVLYGKWYKNQKFAKLSF